MPEYCEWLHEKLELLPAVKFPFDLNIHPNNGAYFFYEEGETWGHGGHKPRIVQIGTHRDGNFKSRIKEHFLLDERKMNFDKNRPSPHERSIFRKNIGRALLNMENDTYLQVWEIDFTTRRNRERFGHLRDISKEKEIEPKITRILRPKFSFRFIVLDNQAERMGSEGIEASLIGTLSRCNSCGALWLGNFSPKKEIRESGLWLAQHLRKD